jgi:peptide deformylase
MIDPDEVLLLGDPRLRQASAPVGDVASPRHRAERARLIGALQGFRERMGFGRAMAAPQIGIPRRFVALELGDGPFVIADPRITACSAETFTLWDDCMSFPDLLVRVRRHVSIDLEYTDERGERVSWRGLSRAHAELLQHEIDHLDGVLAVDRVTEPGALVLRSVWNARRSELEALVDPRPG